MRRAVLASAAVCGLLAGCTAGTPPPSNDASVAGVPTVVILDASASMAQDDAPGPRIDAAKAAVRELLDGLPDDAVVGLEAFGSTVGSAPEDKPAGCQDVTVLAPVAPLDRNRIPGALEAITPSGFTPIGLALETAVRHLPPDDQPQTVVLVSDGEDTCDIPPCEVAARLQQLRPGLSISTVGFKVDGPAAAELSCIADATDGLFVQAANANQLAARLLATQDVELAHESLSPTGLGGISLGATGAHIRLQHPKFPAVGPTETVTVEWIDSDFDFVDGKLVSIRPHSGGRTIDGVTVGSPVGTAGELYGAPVAVTPNTDGTSTVVFDADPGSDAGYQMTVADFGVDGASLSGTIKQIVLCLCKPKAVPSPVAAVYGARQVNPADYERASWTTTGSMYPRPGAFSFQTPSTNIICHWYEGDSDTLVCGLGTRMTPPPSRPQSCEEYLAWNTNHVVLTADGATDGVCAGGIQVPYQATELPYGSSVIAAGFGCLSEEAGVTCVHLASGSGFFVSREDFQPF